MLIVGLTGGIGAGKSTVARRLDELGAVVIDVDAIGREVLLPGGRAESAVVAEFGPGVVGPDVSRQVPVPSLASGRVTEIDARLGDAVQKGQLLFKVRSSDIAGAFSNYRQAVKNEELTKIQLARANALVDPATPG